MVAKNAQGGKAMNADIDYVAVRDDLRSRIEQLQVALNAVENILGSMGTSPSGNSSSHRSEIVRHEAESGDFLGLSISDAAQKYLEAVRAPKTIAQIHDAIQQGGMPHTKYNAVYTALWRREHPNGIFGRVPNSETLWGLAAWYPTSVGTKKKAKPVGTERSLKPPNSKKRRAPGPSIVDIIEKLLRDEGHPLHASVLVERLDKAFNRQTSVRSISGAMPKDVKKRFENLGGNRWALADWSLSEKQLPFE
jgi:hypothetical protein